MSQLIIPKKKSKNVECLLSIDELRQKGHSKWRIFPLFFRGSTRGNRGFKNITSTTLEYPPGRPGIEMGLEKC